MKRALARLSLVAGMSASLGCSSTCELNDDLRLFAGDDAVDCGTADAEHTRADVDQCISDAFEAGTAFLGLYARQGTDSKLVVALARNSAGKVKIFRWDSSPCGGGDCTAVTDAQDCQEPKVSLETPQDPEALPLECESLGLAQRVCG
jgi:hypothetical protein